ncbi:MAG: enoyl-CoA hydratase-related protein, partial [Myxococcota bacterium]|nr:enoyl-CoA hydratase-related protein [Myxococcota bacterium]
MSETIHVSVEDYVARVTLLATTMTPEFFTAIRETFNGLANREDVRCVVLRSEQRAFSYGLDLMKTFQEHGQLMMGGGTAGPRAQLRKLILQWQDDISTVANCPVPVIAAVQGWCIGGGVDLITACDIRLCSSDAKLSVREAKMAIVADLGSLQRLPPIVGQGVTRELAYTARDITADEAIGMRLVNHIYADRDALDTAAMEMAHSIAANAPLVVQGTKHVLDVCAD